MSKPQADDANYVFSEVPVRAEVTSAGRATLEELVDMGRRIWHAVLESKVAKTDDKGNDALLTRLQAEFKDFSESFPIVLRWMVQMREFNAHALGLYIRKHAVTKLDSREAFLTLQADYLVLLYRETHRHTDEAFLKRYHESIVQNLLDEDKAFLDMTAEVEKEMAVRAAAVDADRRHKLRASLIAARVAASQ